MDHLAVQASDQERSRHFYETYCGFGARPPRRYDDDTLMLFDERGFALALGRGERGFEPHFGRRLASADAVREPPSDSTPTARAGRALERTRLRQRQGPRP